MKKTITASGVHVDMMQGKDNIVVLGDRLDLDVSGGALILEGDAQITVKNPIFLEARAKRITVDRVTEVVELTGGVHARVGIPHKKGAGDGT